MILLYETLHLQFEFLLFDDVYFYRDIEMCDDKRLEKYMESSSPVIPHLPLFFDYKGRCGMTGLDDKKAILQAPNRRVTSAEDTMLLRKRAGSSLEGLEVPGS